MNIYSINETLSHPDGLTLDDAYIAGSFVILSYLPKDGIYTEVYYNEQGREVFRLQRSVPTPLSLLTRIRTFIRTSWRNLWLKLK